MSEVPWLEEEENKPQAYLLRELFENSLLDLSDCGDGSCTVSEHFTVLNTCVYPPTALGGRGGQGCNPWLTPGLQMGTERLTGLSSLRN